jgi:hypothetical protein
MPGKVIRRMDQYQYYNMRVMATKIDSTPPELPPPSAPDRPRGPPALPGAGRGGKGVQSANVCRSTCKCSRFVILIWASALGETHGIITP